jgi:hypothetical protein
MNIKHWSAALLVPATLFFLAACQVSPTGSDPGALEALANFKVELSAAKGATEIEVVTPDQGCSTDQKGNKGCVQCKKGEACTIEFKLNLGEGQLERTCTVNPPPDWVITKVELSAHNIPQTDKGDFNKRATGWMMNAFPGLIERDGTVYGPLETSKATQSATIIDLNNHRYGSVKTAYYQVTASSCAAGIEPITIDPAIKNEGR